MTKKIEHAQHNKSICEELHKQQKYNDWTITTAFYSALHFTDLKVYPFTSPSGTICKNIAEVCDALGKREKHAAKIELVRRSCPSIIIEYKWLRDQSQNARYTSFITRPDKADKAVKYLKKIEKFCTS